MPRHRLTSSHESEPPPRRSRVDIEPDALSEAEIAKAFHGQRVSVPVIVLTTLITAGASVLGTYFATRGPNAPIDCASKDSVATLDRKFDQLNTSFSALTEKVITDSERQHNDLVDLKLKVIEQGRAK